MKKNYFLNVMGGFFVLALSSCSMPSQSFGEEDVKIDQVQEQANYFVQVENDTFVFDINTNKYSSIDGSTFFKIFKDENDGENLPYCVKVSKKSGHSDYGYGIIFNYTKGLNEGEYQMLCVMIKISGEVVVGKVVNGVYEDILYWQKNYALKTGLGNENKINVLYNEQNMQYEIIFNDVETEKIVFKDDNNLRPTGAVGIVATVSPNENFPAVPVSVKYII